MISGTEIKTFKDLSYLVRCTGIVVFTAGEEGFGKDSDMQAKRSKGAPKSVTFGCH